MKTVKLIDKGNFKAKELFRGLLGNSPTQGINLSQMRGRVKLMDVIEASEGETLQLEDAQFDEFKRIIDSGHFAIAHPDLLAVIDAAITPIDTTKS